MCVRIAIIAFEKYTWLTGKFKRPWLCLRYSICGVYDNRIHWTQQPGYHFRTTRHFIKYLITLVKTIFFCSAILSNIFTLYFKAYAPRVVRNFRSRRRLNRSRRRTISYIHFSTSNCCIPATFSDLYGFVYWEIQGLIGIQQSVTVGKQWLRLQCRLCSLMVEIVYRLQPFTIAVYALVGIRLIPIRPWIFW